jgi:hypothetical protein
MNSTPLFRGAGLLRADDRVGRAAGAGQLERLEAHAAGTAARTVEAADAEGQRAVHAGHLVIAGEGAAHIAAGRTGDALAARKTNGEK